MSSRARRVGDHAAVEPFPWTPVGVALPSPQRLPQVARSSASAPIDDAAIERDAFVKGYAQGERAGTEASAARAEAMLKRLGQTINELAGFRSEMLHRTERQAVQLVLAIAERVVHREVMLDRGLLVGMARAALDRLGDYRSATIRLHPDDFQAVGAKAAVENAPVQIVADGSVARGGCQVQSDFGFMDVSPESQFRELARALLSDSEASPAEVTPSHGIVLK